MPGLPHVAEVDAFDLPDWLGSGEVTWTALSTTRGAYQVSGELSGAGAATSLGCDLLAADHAYPQPVLDETWRRSAHQLWTYGQVTLAVPGTEFTADEVLESLNRLAKAVGVKPSRFVAALRL